MKNIGILFSGTGTNFKYILDNLHNKKLNVALAITNNPKAKGIEFAKEYNIPLYIIDSKLYSNREEFDKRIVKTLQKYELDLVVLAGFMRILTPIFTEQIKAINLHPSLLPRHKGLRAIERSFEDEFEDGGVSVHWVSSELDSGEIIIQKSIKKEGLDFNSYYNKIRQIEKEALKEAILKTLNLT
ncbi:MAG: phosphoribosylglycinamide formyltransferase [Epsilonproteobacteria bacterium]|nr:phosphoribosylglycinamide formyltransferase [Campylobacterota bacterium]